MCGITGVYHFRGSVPVEPSLIGRMCHSIRHRGPDDEGYHVKGPIGLGHRRLSIIDVGGGHQPISNEDGSVWVVFNGEIYNHHELRHILVNKGHRFATTTDTEVIVHAYEEYGTDCLSHFRGMFAFALWDERKQTLFMGRDRVGKKPLFYTITPDGSLVFASEIKAILEYPQVAVHLNLLALDQYLHLLYVPSPHTIYDGIYKLPAGHALLCTSSGARVFQYWDLLYPHNPVSLTPGEWEEQFLELFQECVRLRLESEVPLGAFLSGGLDSSSVVALMCSLSTNRSITTSVGFNDDYFNELPYAKEVADFFHTEHYEYQIAPTIQDLLPRIVWHFDEPFADSSAIPTYYVSEIARRHVTVALSGDGGDEVFGGYGRHRQVVNAENFRGLRSLVGHPGAFLVNALWPTGLRGRGSIVNVLSSPEDAVVAQHYDYLLTAQLRDQLLSGEVRNMLRGQNGGAPFHSYYQSCTAQSNLDKALYVDIKTYLADDILVKVDRMSMAHGLEVRSPLLDHKLLEFMAKIPPSYKIRGRNQKFLLREVMRKRLPAQVTTREKHGFGMPLGRWLQQDLREMVEDLLFDQTAKRRGLFNPDVVQTLWSSHLNGTRNWMHLIYALLVFELWSREFSDGPPHYANGSPAYKSPLVKTCHLPTT